MSKKPKFNVEDPSTNAPTANADQVHTTIQELKKKLEGKSLMVAMPCYGGMMSGFTAKSMNDLAIISTKLGINVSMKFIFNESLITRARNYLVDDFFRSNLTHMMFIDSDIYFNALDVLVMLSSVGEKDPVTGKPLDIIGGLYPKKALAADKMKAAVESGLCNDNIEDIFKYGADLVINLVPGVTSMDVSKPVEVSELGTGFMMFSKEVINKMRHKYPETKYLPDHARTENFDGSRPIYALFDCAIDPVSLRYLSEDYLFCARAKKVGLNVFALPFIELGHIGSTMFKGTLGDMAKLNNASGKNVNPSGPIN